MRKRTRVVSDFDGFDVICILPKLTNKSKRVTYQERKKRTNNMEEFEWCTYGPNKSYTHTYGEYAKRK